MPRHYCSMKGNDMLQETGTKGSGTGVKVVGPADGKAARWG